MNVQTAIRADKTELQRQARENAHRFLVFDSQHG